MVGFCSRNALWALESFSLQPESVTLHLPADAEITFRRIWGDTLDRRVLEALLMDGYRF
jgi:hypothetical protein